MYFFKKLAKHLGYKDFYEKIQKSYFSQIRSVKFNDLEGLIALTNIKPCEEIVQQGYIELLDKYAGEINIEELEELTKIKPKIPESIVQKKYLTALDFEKVNETVKQTNGQVSQFDVISHIYFQIEKITGIKPKFDDEEIQSLYWKHINNKNMSYAEIIRNITKIEPKLSETFIQEKFKNYLDEINCPYLIESLIILTDIEPKLLDELVQKKFNKLISDANYGEIEYLKRILNVEPKFTEEAVQTGYKTCIYDFLKYADIKNINAMTKIKPDEKILDEVFMYSMRKGNFIKLTDLIKENEIIPSENLINNWYKFLLDRGYVEEVKKLMETTKINPSDELIQNEYVAHANAESMFLSQIKVIKLIYEITKVKPTKKTQDQMCEGMLNHMVVESLASLKELIADIPEKLIQKSYLHFLSYGHFKECETLEKYLNVKPDEKTIQEAYKHQISSKNYDVYDRMKMVVNTEFKELHSEYINVINDGSYEEIIEFEKRTGLKTNESIQRKYQYCIQKNEYAELNRLKTESNIELSEQNQILFIRDIAFKF